MLSLTEQLQLVTQMWRSTSPLTTPSKTNMGNQIRGFTLIEMLIVVIILAILGSIFYASYVDSLQKGVVTENVHEHPWFSKHPIHDSAKRKDCTRTFVYGRSWFAKRSIHDGSKGKNCTRILDFGVAMPLSRMGFAGWRLNRKSALLMPRFLRALPTPV